jgi:nicotinamide-nucleotide amidase
MKDKPDLDMRILKIFGLKASDLREALKDYSGRGNKTRCEVRQHHAETHIVIRHFADDVVTVSKDLDNMEKEIRAFAGAHVFAEGDQSMEGVVGKLLMENNCTLSVAESCTGGLIGSRLTDVPGSSSYFMGGVIVYGNQAKIDLLKVSGKTLDENGAVSSPAVREMAQGVRDKLRSDLGIAVTGIAGPDGGSKDKPVGTVFIGLASKRELFSERYFFRGTRVQIKRKTSSMALDWVRRFLNGNPFIPGV